MRSRTLAATAVALLAACNGTPGATSETCASCGGQCEIDTIPVTDRTHTTDPVDYPDPPPVGGPHSPCWTTWGVHAEAVPDENWVHNLEHGGVVFLYDCPDGCDSDVAELAAWVETLDNRAVLTPYPEMSWSFAAVSWEHRLLLGCLDLPAMQQFYDDHVNQAPEQDTAEPPSSCP